MTTLTFKQYLLESTTNHDLFIGRFQPFHKGHANIIKSMKNPVVVIIKGKQTSEDKQKNPLSAEQQMELIKTVFPTVPVFVSEETGFIPALIGMAEEKGYKIGRVFAGADRIGGYKGQVERANKKIELGQSEHKPINVKFVETPRFTSATTVRNTIRSGDFKEYNKLMPQKLANEKTFKKLQSAMNNSKEAVAEGSLRDYDAYQSMADRARASRVDRDAKEETKQRFEQNMRAGQLEVFRKHLKTHQAALEKTNSGSTAYNIIAQKVKKYEHLIKQASM